MEKRRLGRTGHMSTVVILGTAAFWEVDQETANASMDVALEAGINHIDVAPQYGLAEERVGPWLESRRDQFFLGCKTLERKIEGSWKQLHESLQKLRTDQLDLYQLHAITGIEELDKAFTKDGAIHTLQRAKDEGITKYLGLTGHGLESVKAQIEALKRFDFDTVMFPINPVLYANPVYRDDSIELLEMCISRDVGVMIIKSVAKGPWASEDKKTHTHTTWYEPYDDQKPIDNGVWFALSQAGVTGIPSAGDTRLLPKVIDAANRYHKLSDKEQAELISQAEVLEPLFT